MDVDFALESSPNARLAYISPRLQFPLGHKLSIPRRQTLENWALQASAWIIEDDHSDDFSISGEKDSRLALDDDRDRTILLGAFNKILFPSLRAAFAVVPNRLLPHLVEFRRIAGGYAPLTEQLVLDDFIRNGHLDRYIRRSVKLSSERFAFMTNAIDRHLNGSNTHLIGWLSQHEEQIVVDKGAALGLELVPLSRFRRQTKLRPGLLLGYGGFSEAEIEIGIKKLRIAIDGTHRLHG